MGVRWKLGLTKEVGSRHRCRVGRFESIGGWRICRRRRGCRPTGERWSGTVRGWSRIEAVDRVGLFTDVRPPYSPQLISAERVLEEGRR